MKKVEKTKLYEYIEEILEEKWEDDVIDTEEITKVIMNKVWPILDYYQCMDYDMKTHTLKELMNFLPWYTGVELDKQQINIILEYSKRFDNESSKNQTASENAKG